MRKFIYGVRRKLVYKRGFLRFVQLVPVLIGLTQATPARAGTLDLGTVVNLAAVSGTINVSPVLHDVETYSYGQLLFVGGNLNLQLDGGLTVAQRLEQLFTVNQGSLSYDFTSGYGAAGTFLQTSSGNPGSVSSFMAATISGNGFPGHNTIGSVDAFNVLDGAGVLNSILGNPPGGEGLVDSTPTSVISGNTITLGTLGGNTIQGDVVNTTWQESASPGGAAPSPEPAAIWLVATGLGLVMLSRRLRSRGAPCPSQPR